MKLKDLLNEVNNLEVDKLSNEDLSLVLDYSKKLESIAKTAIAKAVEKLQNGEVVPTYALKVTKGKRAWDESKEKEIVKLLKERDFSDSTIYVTKLNSFSGFEKLIPDFDEVFKDYLKVGNPSISVIKEK